MACSHLVTDISLYFPFSPKIQEFKHSLGEKHVYTSVRPDSTYCFV